MFMLPNDERSHAGSLPSGYRGDALPALAAATGSGCLFLAISGRPSKQVPRNYITNRKNWKEHVESNLIQSQSVAIVVLDSNARKHKPVVRPGVHHTRCQQPQQQVDRQADQPDDHKIELATFLSCRTQSAATPGH